MSLCQAFSGDRTTDERLTTKDVKTIRLLNTLYTASEQILNFGKNVVGAKRKNTQ